MARSPVRLAGGASRRPRGSPFVPDGAKWGKGGVGGIRERTRRAFIARRSGGEGSDDVTAPRRHHCAMVGLRQSTSAGVPGRSYHDRAGPGGEGVPDSRGGRGWPGRAPQTAAAGPSAGVFRPATALRCRHGSLFGRAFRCADLRFRGRETSKPGHEVRLISPAYGKPFPKRQKNAMADAGAICDAARRPCFACASL